MARPAWRELENLRGRIQRAAFRAVREGREALGRALYAQLEGLRPTRGKESASEIWERLQSEGYRQPTVASIERDAERLRATFAQAARSGTIPEMNLRGMFAATKQIWQDEYSRRYDAILEYFYGDSGPEAQAFREWAEGKGYGSTPNLFAVEEYIREKNEGVYRDAAQEKGYPNAAFERLVTFG